MLYLGIQARYACVVRLLRRERLYPQRRFAKLIVRASMEWGFYYLLKRENLFKVRTYMTTLGKSLVAIIVVAIGVIGWAWWDYSYNNSAPDMATATAPTTAGTSSGMATDTPPPTSTGTGSSAQASGASQISSGDDSDASLNGDLNSIDTQMNAANSDSASADQSFNDQPVQQGQ